MYPHTKKSNQSIYQSIIQNIKTATLDTNSSHQFLVKQNDTHKIKSRMRE